MLAHPGQIRQVSPCTRSTGNHIGSGSYATKRRVLPFVLPHTSSRSTAPLVIGAEPTLFQSMHRSPRGLTGRGTTLNALAEVADLKALKDRLSGSSGAGETGSSSGPGSGGGRLCGSAPAKASMTLQQDVLDHEIVLTAALNQVRMPYADGIVPDGCAMMHIVMCATCMVEWQGAARTGRVNIVHRASKAMIISEG